MIDQQTIHADMRRIFAPVTDGAGEQRTDRIRSRLPVVRPAARQRFMGRRFMGREGIAAAGFALAVTGLGLLAAPLLTSSAPPARPVVALAAPMAVAAAPAPAALPAPVLVPAPTTTSPPADIVRRAAIARPTIKRPTRPDRVRRARRASADAALRRALARDAVLTRRLNQDALRRLRDR